MTSTSARRWSRRPARARRAAAALTMTALGLAGVTACGDSAGSDADAVTSEDLQALEDDLASLDERVGVLESSSAESDSTDDGGNALPGVGLDDLLEDPQSFHGQEVTVVGEISELWTTAGSGAAFRIAGDTGDPIVVVSPDFSGQLDENDDVEVTGTVTSVSSGTFETDFGVAVDALLEDPDGFLAEAAGEPAVAAEQVEVLEPSS